ncbi:MAG: hypothetical protein P8181_08030 [bacterium]
MTDRVYTVDDVLGQRLFEGHVRLPPRWAAYYRRTIVTRALGPQRTHNLKYAF